MPVNQEQEQTVFQRLREWYLDAEQKSGKKRRDAGGVHVFCALAEMGVTLVEQ
jgi:hypothetical protein